MIGRVARNTFFLSSSQVLARLIGFFYFIFLARVLGVKDFGIYVFTTAFIYNFMPVADFGIERLVLRDISRQPEKNSFYLSRLLPLRLFLALISFVLVIVLGLILDQGIKQIFYLAVFGLALIPYNLTFLFSSFLNAREKMEYMALANIMQIVLTAFIGGLFVLLKLSLVWILLAYPLANFLTATTFILKAKKWGLPLGWKWDFAFWKKSLSQSWVFAVLLILAVFYLRLSTVMINLIKGPEATGLYGSAFKFVEAMILIPQSLALALFPLSSRLINQDQERLKRVYLKGLGALLLFSLPFALVLGFGSRTIINLAYGAEYLPAIPVFGVLGLSVSLFFLNALAGNIIQNSQKVKGFLPLAALNFLVMFGLCLVLIPRFSIVGAAWAMVGGELAGLVVNNLFVYRILSQRPGLTGVETSRLINE